MPETTPQLLTQYCKATDFNASTGECVAPFYGPVQASGFLPALDAAEGFLISVVIIGTWAIGFYIKQARRVTTF
ncbi:hypothetical protein [Pseudomonas sp. CGJS7]|uniref:hypothetical protein n=1 Tax=Pseudomonas sp. CGJS7 TaxID=3109348 RepID=UPI00300B7417